MRVRLLEACQIVTSGNAHNAPVFNEGEVVELDERQANAAIMRGIAIADLTLEDVMEGAPARTKKASARSPEIK